MRMTTAQIAAAIGAHLHGSGDVAVTGCAIDSRAPASGSLFACLPGANADGHDFAAEAVQNGCAAVLAARPLPEAQAESAPVLVADDVEKAMARLARHWRRHTRAKVICLTGTAGKTTLKEMLRAILERQGRVSATSGNHNNQIGLPLTILNAAADDDFWVLEAGISHAGDMELLGDIAAPDLAIILNVGPGHTEGLGQRGVAWHKARLLRCLAQGGQALVSGDYPELASACAAMDVEPVYFSLKHKARFHISDNFATLYLDGKSFTPARPLSGLAEAENALAAAACATMLGLSQETIAQGLACAQKPRQRFSHEIWPGQIHVFDDTYNANPLSMRRMLADAAVFAAGRNLPLVAVLGEMGELGGEAERRHMELGGILAGLAPLAIFWTGAHGGAVAKGIEASGQKLHLAQNPGDLPALWRQLHLPRANFAIIFKGSRANKLELHLAALRAMLSGGEDNVL